MLKNLKYIKPCIIGLGYVGLPIYLKLKKKLFTIGYDIDVNRIKELQKGSDRNLEYKKNQLKKNYHNSFITNNRKDIKKSNFYIITVPTPIKKDNSPDLTYVKKSFRDISIFLKKGDIIFLESTVYPGVTEDIGIKYLEKTTKLIHDKDFFIGYSPERINPGDKKHSLNKIDKVISFSKKIDKKKIFFIYKLLSKKLHYTSFIKEAEASKVIENIQRDLNIGFMNEIYLFCKKSGLNFKEVIRLASTKWNFLKFKPGLVGGHCLPVDPYYLAYASKLKKFKTEITLASRNLNNSMEKHILNSIISKIKKYKNRKSKFLVCGMTYKKNVADLRNSLAFAIFKKLKKKFKNQVYGFDPYIKNNKKIMNKINFKNLTKFKLLFVLVEHEVYKKKFKLIDKKKIIKFF